MKGSQASPLIGLTPLLIGLTKPDRGLTCTPPPPPTTAERASSARLIGGGGGRGGAYEVQAGRLGGGGEGEGVVV